MVSLKESSVIKTNCTAQWSAGCIQCKQTQIILRNKWSFYHCKEQGIGTRHDMQQQKGKILFWYYYNFILYSNPLLHAVFLISMKHLIHIKLNDEIWAILGFSIQLKLAQQ